MKARTKLLIECPELVTVNQLESLLKTNGFKVECQAVLLPIMDVEMPKEFKFKSENAKK